MSVCEYSCRRSIKPENSGKFTKDSLPWCGGCLKEITYISYPEITETSSTGKITGYKPESNTPYPPWTTFNGVLTCKEDSKIGQMLKNMDPNYEVGYEKFKSKKTLLPGTIRGFWTAELAPKEFCLRNT
jgi:hypothetical protein